MSSTRRQFFRNLAGFGAVSAAALGVTGVGRGAGASAAQPVRPPGALPEDDFLATCIRCMRCVDACPNHAIQTTPASAGHRNAGTPYIRPRWQACMLCSRTDDTTLRCTAVCPSGALKPVRKTLDDIRENVHMGVAKLDLNLCYSYNNYTCGACIYACPLQGIALRAGLWERPKINPDACVGCGLCERACIRYPQAIRIVPVERAAAEGQSDRSVAGGRTTDTLVDDQRASVDGYALPKDARSPSERPRGREVRG